MNNIPITSLDQLDETCVLRIGGAELRYTKLAGDYRRHQFGTYPRFTSAEVQDFITRGMIVRPEPEPIRVRVWWDGKAWIVMPLECTLHRGSIYEGELRRVKE